MFCRKCGAKIDGSAKVCPICDTPVWEGAPAASISQPTPIAPAAPSRRSIPEEYEPLSPWGYIGLSILFSLPVVGFIFILAFSFNNGNLNRKSYARAYLYIILLVLIVCIVFLLLSVGLGASIFSSLEF